jgi:hypothetical protein
LDSDSNRNRVFLSKCADFFTLYLLLHVLWLCLQTRVCC